MPEDTEKTSENSNTSKARFAGLSDRARTFAAMAALAGKRGTVGGLRTVLPILEGYARSMAPAAPGEEPPRINKGDSFNFSDDELKVLRGAGTKIGYELLEITSLTHPVMDELPPYKAQIDPETGRYPAPHLAHFLSLYKAGQSLFASGDRDLSQDMLVERQAMEDAALDALGNLKQAKAITGDDYQVGQQAMTPQQIRRMAMSNQSYSKVNAAEVARGAAAYSMTQRAGSYPEKQSMAYARSDAMMKQMQQAEYTGSYSPCCCGSQTAYPTTSGDDSFTDRLRDCAMQSLCDALSCFINNYCDDDDNDQNMQDCVDVFICSLLRCIPAALCPPKPPAPVQPRPSIECGFAVEEGE